MEEFIRFIKNFCSIFWLTRGITLVLLLILFAASFIFYFFENLSLGNAIYLTFITGLTVGYGDFTPASPLGKITSVFIGFVGMIFIGLIVAIATFAIKFTLRQTEEMQRSHKKRTTKKKRIDEKTK
ncbi:MAG: potassium channel family protein [Pseudomonadota bacterium]